MPTKTRTARKTTTARKAVAAKAPAKAPAKRVTQADLMDAILLIGERVAALETGAVAAEVAPAAPARTRTAKKAAAKKTAAKPAAKKAAASPAKAPKTLTRGRAKALRLRYAKYAGLTREQMLEAGLKGYVLPTGALRASLSQG